MSAIETPIQDVILAALWECSPCPDSPEQGRACRSCEAQVVARLVVQHLIAVDEELLADPFVAPIYQQLVQEQRKARASWWRKLWL